MSSPEVTLTQTQADKILAFAIEKRMYDSTAEKLPTIAPETRMSDAATLVFQARRAWDNGNISDDVKECLFLAEVDMAQAPQPAAAPAQSNGDADASLAGSTDEQLAEALKVLQSYPSSAAIEAEVARIQAEQQRRTSAVQPAPAQPPQAPAPPQEVASPAPQGAPPAPSVPPPTGFEPDNLPPVPGHPNPGVLSAGGPPDATPQSGPQAPQPGAEGVLPQASSTAQAGADERAALERVALEGQITMGMLTAYGLTSEQVSTLSDEHLRAMIANPGGLAAPPAPPATTPTVPPQGASVVSPEREALEERITGPLLKAWKSGRAAVPDIGDAMLRLMVEHPDGRVTQEEVAQARAIDSGVEQKEEVVPVPQPAPQQAAPPPVPLPVMPEQPVVGVPAPSPAPPPAPLQPFPQPQSLPNTANSGTSFTFSAGQPASTEEAREAAMAIIAREHLPIPADIEGDPPVFPNDVSKVSDAELFSLHARMHACESRVNWLINQREDEIHGIEKLLRNRRREVRSELPKTQDGKRLTKDEVETMIEADAQVQQLVDQLDEVEKISGTFKTLRDNYRKDVAVCSRQYSFRRGEEEGIPSR